MIEQLLVEQDEKLNQRYPFIDVVGPVGVGKSTVVQELENSLQVYGLKEPYLDNPYLDSFYRVDKEQYSFISQMFFLTEDGKEALNIKRTLPDRTVLKDAGHKVNHIIATVQWKKGWMSDDDFEAYKRCEENIYKDAPSPDVYIALTAQKETVIRRIKERGRENELIMMNEFPDYFPMLVDEFNNWLAEEKGSSNKVVVIDTDKFDFSKSLNIKDMLLDDTTCWLNYYLTNPHQRGLIGTDGSKLVIPEALSIRPQHLSEWAPGRKRFGY